MPVAEQVDTRFWDYGQRQPRFSSWGELTRAYNTSFPASFTSTLGYAQPPGQQSQRFWREILPKDEELNRQYERLRGMMGGMTSRNMANLGQYEAALGRNLPQASQITQQQIASAMAPFTGRLESDLQQARQQWASSATGQANTARQELQQALGRWDTARRTGIAGLGERLGQQLETSTRSLNELLARNYGQESALNREYSNLRQQLSQLAQNRAMNQLLEATAPGMGSVMSDYTRRAAMRMAQDAAVQDAAAINQMQRDSLLRRLAGELGLAEKRAAMERSDISDLARLGLGHEDALYQQSVALANMDDARRRQIIDQILGSGRLSDIGYLTGAQAQMLGRPQALLATDAQGYLLPAQARQTLFAGELGMVPRAAEALHAANWLAVGTSGNQGGYPVYASPPPLPPIRDVLGPYYNNYANTLGYLATTLAPTEDIYSRIAEQGRNTDLLRQLSGNNYGRIYS